MAISNLSTGLRPGVCTSTTRPSTPFEGQMIYETDTDLTYIYGGSAWQQVSGGTAVGNSGLVYITGGTQSGSTALNVDNCFTSTYRNYRIVMSNIAVETAGRALRINFRKNGSTNTNANYDYGYNGYKANGTTNNTAQAGQTFAEIGVYLDTFGTATLGSSTFDVITPQISTERTFGLVVANGYEGAYYWRSGGFVQGQTGTGVDFDGFRISLSGSGNVSFTWAVYGYRIA